jgi:hypothetical protein
MQRTTASRTASSRAHRPPEAPKRPDQSPSALPPKPAERPYAPRLERERASRSRKRNSRACMARARTGSQDQQKGVNFRPAQEVHSRSALTMLVPLSRIVLAFWLYEEHRRASPDRDGKGRRFESGRGLCLKGRLRALSAIARMTPACSMSRTVRQEVTPGRAKSRWKRRVDSGSVPSPDSSTSITDCASDVPARPPARA